MEDTLGANGNNQLRMCQPVLILVLMEDTLGEERLIVRYRDRWS